MGTFPLHMGVRMREMFPPLLRVTIPNDPPSFLPSFTRVVGHMFAKVLYTHEGEKERKRTVDAYHNSDGEGQS